MYGTNKNGYRVPNKVTGGSGTGSTKYAEGDAGLPWQLRPYLPEALCRLGCQNVEPFIYR